MSTEKKLEELADEWARQRNWITSGRVCGDLFEESAMGFAAGYAAGQQVERERCLKLINEAASVKIVGNYGEYNDFNIDEEELELLISKVKNETTKDN